MAIPRGADTISAHVLQELAGTEYACSSAEPLAGGTGNFVYRGLLTKPLADGTKEVLIKHGEAYLALKPSFKLPTSRCRFEEDCLRALEALPPASNAVCSVRTPRLFRFSRATNTQLQEYLPGSLDLKSYALRHYAAPAPAAARAPCLELGRGLGAWLRAFHGWAREPARAALRGEIALNAEMQGLKHMINYRQLPAQARARPAALGDAEEVFAQVAAMARAELEDEGRLQIIHGDFWTGNALLPDRPLEPGRPAAVFVIDWELCQLGIPPLDLGQMIAELYELKLFRGIDAGLWLVEGFAAGYGYVDDAFAFRTAIQVGVHLVCFGTVPGWGSPEQMEGVAKTGKDIVVRAWRRDKAWFEGHPLACLFVKQ